MYPRRKVCKRSGRSTLDRNLGCIRYKLRSREKVRRSLHCRLSSSGKRTQLEQSGKNQQGS